MTDATPAPHNDAGNTNSLPVGTRVAEFEVRDVLGSGGFGIVYLAWDHALEREVALKEYMPGTLAGRNGGLSVSVRSQSMADTFALGLRSFVNEARMLARFDHPSLVKVYRFWEDNGTAYMVMPHYPGRTLRKVRAGMVMPPGEGACRRVLDALLSALEVLHKEGVFHRDIAPDNILIGDDGVPVLLDFGAARRVIAGGPHQALTSIMKPHFAPLEQYADQSAMRQGPWTDLYALGGTVYFLLTGREPVPAASRALHDDQPALADLGLADCSPTFLGAIDWMLSLKPPDRPQSVQMLRDVLDGRITVPGRRSGERTVPGVASRDTVDILTSPGDLAPVPDAGDSASGGLGPTVLMPRPVEPEVLPQPAQTSPGGAAPAARRAPMLLLAALLVLNMLAWWWFTKPETPRTASTPSTTRSAAAEATPPTAPAAPAASEPAATVAVPPDADASETILSVLPARGPHAAATAASGSGLSVPGTAPPPRNLEAPLPRGAALEPTPSKVMDASATAARGRVTPPEIADPRARCADRTFLSQLICLKRECQNVAFSAHPECVRLREQETANRSSTDR